MSHSGSDDTDEKLPPDKDSVIGHVLLGEGKRALGADSAATGVQPKGTSIVVEIPVRPTKKQKTGSSAPDPNKAGNPVSKRTVTPSPTPGRTLSKPEEGSVQNEKGKKTVRFDNPSSGSATGPSVPVSDIPITPAKQAEKPAQESREPAIVVSDRPTPRGKKKASLPADENEKESRVPRWIEAVMKKYQEGRGFDIVDFLDKVRMESMSLADVMYWSYPLRRIVTQSFKTVPKEVQVRLMQTEPFMVALLETTEAEDEGKTPLIGEENQIEAVTQDKEPEIRHVRWVTISKSGTHKSLVAANGTSIIGHLDNGCCVVCVQSTLRKKHGWKLATRAPSIQLRTATGSPTDIEGEVDNFVIRVAEHIEVPLTVLSVHELDVPILLGRPFLEILQAQVDCKRALYNVVWNGHWATMDAVKIITTYHRQLTKNEVYEWENHSRPPIVRESDDSTDADSAISIPSDDSSSGELEAQIGNQDQDDGLNRDGEQVANVYLCRMEPLGLKTYKPSEYNGEDEILTPSDIKRAFTIDVPGQVGSPLWWRNARALIQKSHVMENSIPNHRAYLTRVTQNTDCRVTEMATDEPIQQLSIASWNVNSVRNLVRANSPFTAVNGGLPETALSAYLERMGIDVLILQEARLTHIGDAKPGIASIPGYISYFTFATHIKGYSGVALYARSGLVSQVYEGFIVSPKQPVDVEGRVIQCVIGKLVIIGIYAPNAREQPDEREQYKKDFFSAIAKDVEHHQALGFDVVVVGDYNVVYRKEDIYNERLMTGANRISPCALWEEELVLNMMDKHRLIDPHLLVSQKGHPRFSCWEPGKLRGQPKRSLDHGFRIDYALVSQNLKKDVIECHLLNEEGSDHLPLILRLRRGKDDLVESEGVVALVQPGPLVESTNDWKLNPIIVKGLENHWRQYGRFEMDLFANHHNAQFEKYCVENDEEGRRPNAWSIDWMEAQGDGMLWANPPWKSIPRLLRKVQATKTTVAITAPVSPQNQWYATLLSMAISDPVMLPRDSDTFWRKGKEVVNSTPWGMTAVWLVSGERTRREEYLKTLRIQPTKKGPVTPVTSDFAGFTDGKWIPWRYLDFTDPPPYAYRGERECHVGKIMSVQAEPIAAESATIGGAKLRWNTYEGKSPTPVTQMDPSRTGGRILNIGILPEVEEYRSDIEKLFEQHLEEFLEPGGIARTLTNVEPMTVSVNWDLVKKNGGLPVAKPLRLPPAHVEVLNKYDDKMTAADKIEESTSTTSALPMLVEKKDDTWRIVFNYAPVAKYIDPLVWPLEPMDQVLQKMALHRYRCSFDHSLGYHQIPLHPDYRYLTAFVFPRGLRQYKVAPMGWKDSAEWMAKHLSRVYNDREFEGNNALEKSLAMFRDDGMIGADDIPTLLEMTGRVLRCVKRFNGTLSDKKSYWFVKYVMALGFLVGNKEIIPEESKIRAVIEWPAPKTQSNLKSQIMFAQFLKHMVPEYGNIVSRIYPLFKGEFAKTSAFQREWKSNPDYALAITQLKQAFGKAATVRTFDPNRPVIIAADASLTGIGGVAGHAEDPKDDDNITVDTVYTPCAFYSRQLTPAEAKLGQPYREMMGVIDTVRKCEPYLSRKIVIYTDHKAWVSTHNEMTPIANKKVDMMRMYLSTLPCSAGYPKFIFREGKKQLDVDPLSRLDDQPIPDREVSDEIEERVQDPVVLKMFLLNLGWEPYDSIIRWLRGEDISSLTPQKRASIMRQALQYFIGLDDGKLYLRSPGGAAPRLVPAREDVVHLIEKFHGDQLGHLNTVSTYEHMARRYFWHNMWKDIDRVIHSCPACEKRKRKWPVGRFQLYRITPPPTLFVMIGMDGCALPKSSDGMCGFIVMICYTSGWVEATPVRHFEGRKTRNIVRDWCMHYGYPKWIICDRAGYFVFGELPAYAAKHKILLCPTASQHPMGNGKAEKANDLLVSLIARRLNDSNDPRPNQWTKHLRGSVADFRHHTSRVNGTSPYRYVYGQDARMPSDNEDDIYSFQPEELREIRTAFTEEVERLREEAYRLRLQQLARDEADNKKLPSPHEYKVGDLVWVRDDKLYQTFSSERKLKAICTLCRVKEVLLGGTYLVLDAETGAPYKRGDPVSHWRMRPVTMKPEPWEVGKPALQDGNSDISLVTRVDGCGEYLACGSNTSPKLYL